MCRPTYFDVTYVINPWMENQTVDTAKAIHQWENLVATYRDTGITVEIIEQQKDLPDMVFTTDQGVVREKKVLMSNFFTNERKGETDIYLKWFKAHEYQPVFLKKHYTFEGNGELLEWNGRFLVGIGFRTAPGSCKEIAKVFDTEVIPLKLINPFFYHLDTCLFPLDNETVFYYPQAFDTESKEKLQHMVPNLIPFTAKQAFSFYANSVVSHGKVFCQGVDKECESHLKKRGYELITIGVGEFNKSGGGIHCLTNILESHYV